MADELPSLEAPPPAETSPANDLKRLRKEAKLLARATRTLDPWERYRALVDTLEEAMDLVELADRKTRFALLIMGALNVAFFFLATRTDFLDVLPLALRPFLGFYLLIYAGVALVFFLQAIETLKPRRYRPRLEYPGEAGAQHHPEGLRYYEDIVSRDVEAYRRAWREVRIGQLNAELAVQNHVMARINCDKYRSLRRLYGGLRLLTLLAGGLLAMLALSMLASRQPPEIRATHKLPTPPPAPAASDGAGGGFAAPVALPAGLREASGIAWHAALERFFAVGDRGTLVEIDTGGRVLERHHVKGNLEDVAVHPPSGRLVLLSEKKGELVVWDPASGSETGRFELDLMALVGREPVDTNQGFEGLCFREEEGKPGGGVFYLVHQRKPARLVALSFDPTAAPRTIGAADLVAHTALKPYEDLTAVAWSEPLGRLLVVADSQDRLLLVSPAGSITSVWPLPGGRQEGIAIGPDGALWVADEERGLFKIPGALAALERPTEAAP